MSTKYLTYWERAGLSKEDGDKIDVVIAQLQTAGVYAMRGTFLSLLWMGKTAQELSKLGIEGLDK